MVGGKDKERGGGELKRSNLTGDNIVTRQTIFINRQALA